MEVGLKENVNPVRGLGGPAGREKSSRLGQELRGRDRAGVLAPNSTRGNGGGVDALEWLKDRVSQNKLANKAPNLDSGSKRHQRKLGQLAVVDAKLSGGLGRPSAGLSSKEVGGMVGGRENSSGVPHLSPSRPTVSALQARSLADHPERPTKNQILGSRVQAGAKSPWAANRGVMEIYHDNAMNSQDQRDLGRRQGSVKSAEEKVQSAASLLDRDLTVRPEMEEHAKVSLNSGKKAGISKLEQQEEQASVTKLSPQPRSYGEGSSGLWSGSKVPGTPYKQTSHQRGNAVDGRPEMGSRDHQFSSGGLATGLNLGNARSSVSSQDRREASRRDVKVEAAEGISPGAAAGIGTVIGSGSQINQKVFSTKLEELKFRSQLQREMTLYPRKPPGSNDSGRSSSFNEQDSLYSYTSTMPENAEVRCSPNMETPQCEGTALQKLVYGAAENGAVGLSHISLQPHLGGVESYHKVDYPSRAAPSEKNISTYAGRYSGDRANHASARTGSSPQTTKTQRASTVIAAPGSSMWSRSSAVSRSQAQDHCFPSAQVAQDEGTKWNSTSNMDTVGPGSALLTAEVTGASSSGSSSTPCVMGNSSLDDVTVKSRDDVLPTPSVEKPLSSYQLSNMKQRRINRHTKRSLGPPLRVIVDDADSCNSRISPVPVLAPVIESDRSSAVAVIEEAGKCDAQLQNPLSEPRKRKAEREPCGGNGDTSQSLELRSSVPAPAQAKDTAAAAVQPQRQCARESREMESMPRALPSQLASEEDVGNAANMPCCGFSSEENKENIPVPVLPNMSTCLSSLSLGDEDMPEKGKSKVLSKDNISPILCSAPASQITTLKSVENLLARPPTSRLEGPGTGIETRSRDEVRISPCPPGCKAVGLPYNAEVKAKTTVPSDRVQDSGARVEQLTHGNGMESGQGAPVTSQKMNENSHFVWVNDKRYQKLGKIGKGGSSEVFKVIDSDCNIYALKKINLKGREHRSALGFYQEIEYLEKFIGKRNVIQLIGYEVTNKSVIREDYGEEKILEDACIYMVLEFGEIDQAGILIKKRKEMMESNENFDDNWLRFYWKHMLLAVKTIHDERIVHADLKPANFLLVKGELKLIDFGIAKAIQNDTTHIVRDSQVGTLNYMSPEAFMANSIDDEGRMVKCGRSSDIWSLGCILYQMVYGHTPFSKVDSFYAKIQAITSRTHKIEFPPIPDPWLLDVLKKCLTWDRHSRPHINDLLEHPFLRPELANQQKFAA